MLGVKSVERLHHICSSLDRGAFDPTGCVRNIATGEGSPAGSALQMQSYCLARAMRAWFEYFDISEMKKWFYLSGKFQVIYLEIAPDKMNAFPRVMDFSQILLSDCEPLISRFCSFTEIYDSKRISSLTTLDYHAFNIILAARGEMDLLALRCEASRKNPPKSLGGKFIPDNLFLAALAEGDQGRMEEVLNGLVTPKIIRSRSGLEGGYTKDLISTSVVLYAKLAWRHGFNINVESALVPSEWMPISPLSYYDPTYECFVVD